MFFQGGNQIIRRVDVMLFATRLAVEQWSEHQIEILFDGYSPQQGNAGLDTIIFAIHGVGIGCRFEPIAGQQVRELVKNRSEYLF